MQESSKFIAMLKKLFSFVKPWLLVVALFVLMRFTGVGVAINTAAQSALLKTGVMDVSVDDRDALVKKFDYDFTLLDARQNHVDMNTLKGKTLFINLWATWCGPCRVEMPSIQKLYDGADKDKVAFIMLALDQKDPFNKVSDFIEDKRFTFPVYYPASALPQILQVPTIPTTFVVSPDGKVVHKQVGVANYDTEEFRTFLHQQ